MKSQCANLTKRAIAFFFFFDYIRKGPASQKKQMIIYL